jgi:hypothetical protein
MVNHEIAIIATIAAIMISIPVTYFPLVQGQEAPAEKKIPPGMQQQMQSILPPHNDEQKKYSISNPAGLNTTTGSNMTGAAGNTTVGAGSNMTTVSNMTGAAGNTTAAALSSIPTTHPAGTAPDNKVHQVPTNHCVTFGCLHQKGTSPSSP